MSTIARLEVIPIREGNMSEAVASAVGALDRFDVSYETTPTDTVIEADDPTEVFAAAEAAHRAVADERVITSLEVDEHRGRRQDRHERVASVERALGHPPERERRGAGTESRQQRSASEAPQQGAPQQGASQWEVSPQGMAPTGTPEGGTAETELRRYHGPVPTDQQGSSRSAGTRQTGTRRAETQPAQPRSSSSGQRGSRYLQSGRRPQSR